MKILGKIYCFFGLHNWTWSLDEAGAVHPIPDHAVCVDCGRRKGGFVPWKCSWCDCQIDTEDQAITHSHYCQATEAIRDA